MDDAEYIYTETEVSSDVNHAQSLPIDDLVKLGGDIWNDIKKLPEDKSEEVYHAMYNKYRDFGSSFPLILRWMVQIRKYSSKAFRKFLIKYSSAKITTRKDFLILQAEYIVYLYEENKHHDKNSVNLYREFIIKQLLEEDEKMCNIIDETDKEINRLSDEKRNRLYNYIKNIKQ